MTATFSPARVNGPQNRWIGAPAIPRLTASNPKAPNKTHKINPAGLQPDLSFVSPCRKETTMRNLWTLAALLYGGLLETIGFAPGRATRRALPRFVIADIVTRVRPLEAFMRRLLFAQAQTMTVVLRARAYGPPKPPAPAPVTQIITLPHDPLAFRRMMLRQAPLVRLCPPHPLNDDPATRMHVRFCVGAGDYPARPDQASSHASAEKRVAHGSRAFRLARRCEPEGSRSNKGRSNCIPWHKLNAAEKDARRQRRAARNVAGELRKERAAQLAAMAPPERALSPADDALAPTTALARRLEALVRVIRDPAPYARRIARKLAVKPSLVVRIEKRVARRPPRHVGETFAAALRWADADLAVARADSS